MKFFKLKRGLSSKSKMLLLLALFGGSLNSLHAQEDDRVAEVPTSYYIHGGLSLSAVQGGAANGFSKINVLGGVGMLSPIIDLWNFGLEANVVQKGEGILTRNPANQLEQYTADLIYAQLAGYASYDIAERFSVFLGPAFGVLIREKESTVIVSTGAASTEYRTIEVSLIGGLKYHLSNHLGFVFRFDQSILPIKKSEINIAQIAGARQYNTVVAVTVQYSF